MRNTNNIVILRCALLRASKDDMLGPSPFEGRASRSRLRVTDHNIR